ncbi:MAG: helix-turn-helix domain-containing protein [Paludibacteraceae bacterium]|nr:helix-turn-helix domain-containing protein [Paludibacteraceae bacterium]
MNERNRIEQLIEAENMTAKQFAQEVGIQAGTISNIMSGRNNPSLEVLQRVLNRFRTVSSDWLILGVGSMYRPNGGQSVEQTLFDVKPLDKPELSNMSMVDRTEQPAVASSIASAKPATPIQPTVPSKSITRIIIYYSDGTFEER